MSIARIAIVGAGKGGKALLEDLIKIPGISVKYVCDTNPDAEGMIFSKEHGIKTCLWSDVMTILSDPELDLILEVTGQQKVFRYLNMYKLTSVNIISSASSKIIFHFIDTQRQVTDELEEYKMNLEEKIRKRTEEIEWANKELQHRVNEIEELNEKLQEINDMKTKYLLQATHQLKAPFAAIQSYVDVILQGFTGKLPEQTTEIIIKIKTRCQMLSQAIKNMLELANLNSYVEENVKMHKISLGKIARRVIEFFSAMAEKKKITLNCRNTAKDDIIVCNQEQIVIMLSNILDNAIIYSSENTTIDIAIEDREDDRISIAITDMGIGIPEQNIPKIFNEYFRSNNAVKKHENGTGLGLAIAKRIADIHKAEIEVNSIIGKGTTIKVILPVQNRSEITGTQHLIKNSGSI
ncbi:MAG: ATP-binding protein [Elusimicrobia bacterium]|nr:ATP-binding protein [Elusimicrobiota bacterium]